ncbi:MAG: UDP-N-acetylmuramoyl-L-alanyl-D-glutamate--2,6-diaminopimelate ligase, partial [Rhodospirillaceae bacterium]|nr:UDP-N-acetylmuramoyl-L-alanyl-D-glutamate--2,6-diaminopimelate ligase [Rhodospirillaceae bacterium]
VLGIKAASIGTLGVHGSDIDESGSLTTPDAVQLHQTLQNLAAKGIDHVAMEASSHGLAQSRLDGVVLKGAAFTNLSRDHLDYHQSMDDYLAAKLALFSERIEAGGVAVVHTDRPESEAVLEVCRKRGLNIISCGKNGDQVRLIDRHLTNTGQRLVLEILSERFEVTLPLAGSFQTDNALVALALVIGLGAPVQTSVAALEKLKPVAGRMQWIGSVRGAQIYVDYAHTPEALDVALANLRPHTEGKLSVLFGAGGDRDPGKRKPMGAAAMRNADRVIITDDNPRSEDPATVRAQVLQGAPGATEIADRGLAIRAAVAELNQGDVLLVAGKGHEQGQIVGD